MSVCANRPDEQPGFFTPCERYDHGVKVTCTCGEQVREAAKAAQEPQEARQSDAAMQVGTSATPDVQGAQNAETRRNR